MTLTLLNLQALLPILVTSGTAILVMMAIAIYRHHWWNPTLAVGGLNLAVISLYWAWKAGPQWVTPLFYVDGTSIFFMGLILIASLACATLTHAYIERYQGNREEIYVLMTIAAAGGMVMVAAAHLASLFIGLEMMSVSLYGLIGYTFRKRRSLEAAIKYMVLSAAASAFMLFGMALLYAQFGTLAFPALGQFYVMPDPMQIGMTVTASLLILIGFSFKLSLVPFHLWTPDVYEGAPAPVGAFLATTGKVAIMAVLLRMLSVIPAMHAISVLYAVKALAVLSIIIGNLLALRQSNIKRLLGYSSIAHFGYMLIGILLAPRPNVAFTVVGLYLVAYSITAIGSFGVIALMSSPTQARDADSLQDYRGLFWRRPLLTSVFTVTLLSLAGIPLTAGFIGKFYVGFAGVMQMDWVLLSALVLGSAIGVFYYLRAMVTLFLQQPGMKTFDADLHWGEQAGGLMVLGVTGLVLLMGVYPSPLIRLIEMLTPYH